MDFSTSVLRGWEKPIWETAVRCEMLICVYMGLILVFFLFFFNRYSPIPLHSAPISVSFENEFSKWEILEQKKKKTHKTCNASKIHNDKRCTKSQTWVNKTGHAFWVGWNIRPSLSITATIANHGHLWDRECGRGQIVHWFHFCQVCYISKWCSMSSSLIWNGWLALHVTEEAGVSLQAPHLTAVEWMREKQAGGWDVEGDQNGMTKEIMFI